MELVIYGIGIVLLLVLIVFMFILGYRESLRYKVEDPFVIENHMIGEGWENDTFVEYEKIIDILGREPSEDEMREFLSLVEEGYHGDTLLKKFIEKINKKHHH
ncbi:hypothetical protein GWK41_03875 [Persephonella atlantica]|uniref:Uncharacterized protein n=1 Tax=Persephonella atlantica TaxID=2699429 RepID=A0ABS1GGZ9_9AQUI|nr:hypothetical protein [Persephonella atlantica]MBK3332206.1 hypothetical protein [Persephonella atlantica]